MSIASSIFIAGRRTLIVFRSRKPFKFACCSWGRRFSGFIRSIQAVVDRGRRHTFGDDCRAVGLGGRDLLRRRLGFGAARDAVLAVGGCPTAGGLRARTAGSSSVGCCRMYSIGRVSS
eukprot:scaffold550_cov238-Pinguiococcus_pyrenoidosus.AAC.8